MMRYRFIPLLESLQRIYQLSLSRFSALGHYIYISFLVLSLALAACSSKKTLEEIASETIAPEILYNEALADLNQGKVSTAAKKFQEVDRQHPYTQWARKSMIMSAFTNYQSGRYDDAVTAAKRFMVLYPGDKDVAYAQFLVGQSYFKQIPDVTRDQKATVQALNAMRELVYKFPDSEYTEAARQKIRVTEDQIAAKEMQVGRYYLERHQYIAAINRFKNVVRDFQTTRHVEEALHRLTESYYAMGVIPEAQVAAAVLGHNFPDSQWYKDSYDLLNKGGYQPRDDANSWISKTVKAVTG